ncbi:MAG: response regulator [Methanoregulaceae archaeon]
METASPEPQPDGPHILLLQQDPAEAKDLEKLLIEKGCRVTVFLNGNSAYSQLSNLMPDILVSDLIVPDLDGPSLTIRLKNEERFRGIQVILLTRASHLGDLLEVLTCGADAFLPKPIDPGYVSTLIEYLMGNIAAPQKPEPVQTQFRVAYDGNEYSLLTGRRKLLDFLLSSYEIMGIRVSETTDLDEQVKSLTRKIADLEQEHKEKMEDAVAILKQDIAGLESTLGKLQESVADRDRQIEALRSQSRIFEHQVKAKTGEAVDLQAAIAASAEEKKKLEERILALGREFEEKEADLRNRLDTLTSERDDVRSNLDTARRNLQDETARTQQSEQNLATALSGFSDEKKELEERILALRNEADSKESDLQNRLDELVYELSDTRSDFDAAQRSLQEETAKSRKLELALNEAREMVSAGERALRERDGELAKEKQDSARRVQELEEIIATQEEDLKESQGAATSAVEAMKAAEQKNADAAEKTSRTVRELSDSLLQKDEEIRSLVLQRDAAAGRAKKEIAEADASIRKQWEEAASASAEQIRTLQSEISRISEELKGRSMAEEIARAALADRDKRENTLRQQVKDLETGLSEKERLLAGNTADLETVRKESAVLAERVKSLTEDLENKVRVLSTLEKSLEDEREVRSSAETRAFSVAQEKEDAEARAGSLAHEFERMAGRVADLEGVIGARDAEIRTLTHEIEELKKAQPEIPREETSSVRSPGRDDPAAEPEVPVSVPARNPEPDIPEYQHPDYPHPENTPDALPPDVFPEPMATGSPDTIPETMSERKPRSVTEIPLKENPVEPCLPVTVQRSVPVVIAPCPVPDTPRVEIAIVREPEIVREASPAPGDDPKDPNPEQWSAIVDWAHRNGKLSPQERGHLVIMGRLARKGKEPTGDQMAFANEILERAKSAGYQPGT